MSTAAVAADAHSGLFDGIRVLDAGTMIGGPFAATLLGDFGAEVIKVEHPAGDPVRQLLPQKDGIPLWWKVLSRNKKSITIDLSKPLGQELFLRLVAQSDVVVESFRPGTLERWNLGWERLCEVNPSLVLLRVSGFGQSGPHRDRPGFGRFAEAFSGLAHITGPADGPPMHAGLPLADYVCGLMGWGAIASALFKRNRSQAPLGECIDLALYESVFRLLEFLVIEADQLDIARTRQGNSNPYTAPVNTYQAKDGSWITFTASTQSIVDRLFPAIGQPQLRADPRFRTITDRISHRDELDDILARWFSRHTPVEIEAIFDENGVPFAPILDAKEILADHHYRAREAIVRIYDPELGEVAMQGIVPKFSEHPGSVRWTGPGCGAHNSEIFLDLLGISDDELAQLASDGVIARSSGETDADDTTPSPVQLV